jgi:signal transduction histidine kinase
MLSRNDWIVAVTALSTSSTCVRWSRCASSFGGSGSGSTHSFPRASPGVPAVSADPDRLVQVLMNLLSNAVKFCAPGRGRIDVAVSQRGRNVRVDVRDNGAGIPVANQALIFEKFRQAGDTMTSKPPGTGLGLHISRQIIDHFGGRLWVESRPGEGACFSFTLPCEPAEADVGVG